MTKKGQKLYKRAKKIIPGGTMLLSKRPEMFLPDQWPAYFSKSSGNETVLNAVCLASECQKWGLPLMIETIPFGWPKADRKTNEQLNQFSNIHFNKIKKDITINEL